MAFEIPQSKFRSISTQKRNVPLQQIIDVEGQNPLATGIQAVGQQVGAALTKRAQLQQQGKQVAALLAMSQGQQLPQDNGELSPELLDKGLAMKTTADQKRSDRAEKAAKLQLEIEKMATDRTEFDPTTGKTTTYKGKRGLKVGPDQFGDPTIQYGPDYDQGTIPIRGDSGGASKSIADDKLWYNIVKNNDPATASSRSALGLAAVGNAKANRADVVLANPNATAQDVAAGTKDFASIIQGGAPTDSGTHELEYNTLAQKWGNLQTLLTSKPTPVQLGEIKQHLRDVIKDLKDVNTRTIQDNFDYTESAHPEVISAHANAWKNMRLRSGAGLLQPIQPNPPGTFPVVGSASQASNPDLVQKLIGKHK